MTQVNPKLRKRVIGNPISLIPPRWESDPNFDLNYHIRRYQVAGDGTDTPLLRIAEQLGEQDFDRDRPLWEMAVVQGFDGERSAVIIKLHHAITDGVGGMAMAATLFDLTRTPSDLGPPPDDPDGQQPGLTSRLANGVQFGAHQVVKRSASIAGSVRPGDPHGDRTHTDSRRGSGLRAVRCPPARPGVRALDSLLTGRSLAVRMAVLRMPFADLKAAAKRAGGTINDAYVAAVAGGLGAYHEAHGDASEAVRVNMPINLRSDGPGDDRGNRWVPARFALPIGTGDPVERIRKPRPCCSGPNGAGAAGLDTVYRLLVASPGGDHVHLGRDDEGL